MKKREYVFHDTFMTNACQVFFMAIKSKTYSR